MNIEQSILPIFGKTGKLLDLHIEGELSKAGIPLSKLQFVLLLKIFKNNDQPQCNLAEILRRDKTTFTRNIKTLENKNLVSRIASKKDKRQKIISITPLGQELVQKSKPIISEIVKEVESGISKDEREAFIKTLDKIKTKLLEIRTK